MIRINKSLAITDIPPSLRPPFKSFFLPRNVSRKARTTSIRRNELIRKGIYIDNDVYSSRYKLDDIKKSLSDIYKNKCAFCEQKIEQFHVEHYRPKQLYPWLAFSWDNLIVACRFCNEYKDFNFRINGPRATFNVSLSNLKNINSLSNGYDIIEQPDMVSPEKIDPQGLLRFGKDGDVWSGNPRIQYTIITCKVSRTYLRDRRWKILEDLRKDIKAAFVENKDKASQAVAIKTIVSKFRRDLNNTENEFLAFRKYVLEHWLKAEIKHITK